VSWRRFAYKLLLRCYPKAFRDEYERDMQASLDRLWHEQQPRGTAALARLGVSIVADTATTAIGEHFSILRHDIRIAGRSLRKAPAFTAGVIATLALGIGATTAMFSVVYAILLRPLPFADSEQLIELVATKPLDGIAAFATSGPDFGSWRERTRSFADMAALVDRDVNLSDGNEPERVRGMAVTSSFWSVLGVQPLAGRVFDEGDDTGAGPHRVALLSDGLYRRRYGSNPGLIGRTVDFNGVPHTVIGIVPSDMGFTQDVDVWVMFVPDQLRGMKEMPKLVAALRARDQQLGLGDAAEHVA
jgi:macrolide transport system ATP-binding/permease protein